MRKWASDNLFAEPAYYIPQGKVMDDKPRNSHHVREFTVDELKFAPISHWFAVEERNIFGRRQQRYSELPMLNGLYTLLFEPMPNADPTVTPVRHLTLRYFVIVADKAGARES